MKLTARQRAALHAIAASGETVVIEDDWLIYLADTGRCPFRFANSRRTRIDISDTDVVRKRLTSLPAEEVEKYRSEREARARIAADNAIRMIQTGEYDAAMQSLKDASNEALAKSSKIELFRFEE